MKTRSSTCVVTYTTSRLKVNSLKSVFDSKNSLLASNDMPLVYSEESISQQQTSFEVAMLSGYRQAIMLIPDTWVTRVTEPIPEPLLEQKRLRHKRHSSYSVLSLVAASRAAEASFLTVENMMLNYQKDDDRQSLTILVCAKQVCEHLAQPLEMVGVKCIVMTDRQFYAFESLPSWKLLSSHALKRFTPDKSTVSSRMVWSVLLLVSALIHVSSLGYSVALKQEEADKQAMLLGYKQELAKQTYDTTTPFVEDVLDALHQLPEQHRVESFRGDSDSVVYTLMISPEAAKKQLKNWREQYQEWQWTMQVEGHTSTYAAKEVRNVSFVVQPK